MIGFLVGLSFLNGAPLRAEEESHGLSTPSEFERHIVTYRFRLTTNLEGAHLSKDGHAVSGVGPALAASYAFDDRWSLGIFAGESFGVSGAGVTTLFAKFGARLTWAATGTLTRRQEVLSVPDRLLLRADEAGPEGLRLQFGATQYLFTGSDTVFPFAGFGLSALYEFSLGQNFTYQFGLGVDRISNTQSTIYPLTLFGGVGFSL